MSRPQVELVCFCANVIIVQLLEIILQIIWDKLSMLIVNTTYVGQMGPFKMKLVNYNVPLDMDMHLPIQAISKHF